MTELEEEFIHFRLCIDRLNSAWLILNAVKSNSGNPLAGPAFRYALVEYSTSYRLSRGQVNKKGWKLGTSFIPPEFLGLHNRILDSRDQTHAHTDLTVLEPRPYFTAIDGEHKIRIVQNRIHGLEELTNLDSIIEMIEGTLTKMYEREPEFEKEVALINQSDPGFYRPGKRGSR
mgnify:CR=1 FL=1